MANEWDSVWVRTTEVVKVLEESLYFLEDLRRVVEESEDALTEDEKERGSYLNSNISSYEEGSPYITVWKERKLSPEEIDTAKKAQWLKTKDYRDKKDLEDFLRLKKKFETNDKELL